VLRTRHGAPPTTDPFRRLLLGLSLNTTMVSHLCTNRARRILTSFVCNIVITKPNRSQLNSSQSRFAVQKSKTRRVRFQLPTSAADNVTLLAFAAVCRAVQQSIGISYPPGPQQQTRRSGRMMGMTDGLWTVS